MDTEQPSSTSEHQAEHAALYRRAAGMLAVQAGMLRSLAGPVKLDVVDVAGLYASTAAGVLIEELGHATAISFLRSLADKIAAGKPVEN